MSLITVVFSVPVVGVGAGDLQINGAPALALGQTNAVAIFQFTQPPSGLVTVSFDSDAVITDQTGDLFDPMAAGAAWTYTLADVAGPLVGSAEPASGAVVGALTELEVDFTEPVTGVDASDLLINGVAATTLTVVAPDRYRFGFSQPGQGTVNVGFAVGHGIKDVSPAANAFLGAAWSYSLNPAAAGGDVVINEFLAENRNSLEDEDGQREDWIELRNRGGTAVNLTGWSLTDDREQPGKWTFPNLTLNPGQYLIVFASGKDRKTTTGNGTNHTSFRLSLGGGYLGLFNSAFPRVAVSEFAAYPEQRADISYGLTAGGSASYFMTLTPRAANAEASTATGLVQPPHASVRSGFFNQPFNLVLSTETAGAEVRYTLDGSVPTATNEVYAGPILITGTPTKAVVTLRAAAFKAGQVPSSVLTRTYIFPDHVLTQPANPAGFPMIWDSPCTGFNNCNDINPADYEMDPQVITNTVYNYRALARQGLVSIPTVSIVTDVNLLFGAAQGVYVRREPFLRKPINAELIHADGTEGFQIDCGLEMQGQTSPDDSSTGGSRWKSLKLGLRLFFQGEFGPTKLHYKVFDDSPVEEFDTLMLAGGHNNYWNYNNNDTQRTRALYVRDQYVANLQNALGGRSHHGRFVHLYLNGLYWGLYQLHERPDESFQASYFGGAKEEYDVFKHDSSQVLAGSTATYTALWGILNQGMTNQARYEQALQYVDPVDLINYLLVNFWVDNTDWAHKNLYASHRKNGKWRFHAWDSEHVIATGGTSTDAISDNEGTNPTAIFNRLLANAEFRVLLGDLIHRQFFNGGLFYVDPANPIYNPAFPERNPAAHMFMRMLQSIDTAIVCESARWGDVGPGRENTPHLRDTSFYEERDIVMGYRATFGSHSPGPAFFPSRSTNVMAAFRARGWYPGVVAPSFNQHGGQIPAGFALTMTAPAGTIYYTTNGADPRLYGSGAVSPVARVYSGAPIVISSSMQVKARALVGTNWSALNDATFTVAQLVSPLRITEIMYNPVGGDAFEFIELKNTGGLAIDLSGYSFDGVTFAFGAGTSIGPGATLVLANNDNPVQFAARYPGVIVAGWFAGTLANSGERLSLKDAAGRTVISVVYRDGGGWPTAADGGGSSLELIDMDASPGDPASWRASTAVNGSPGQPNSAPAASPVYLSEIAAENLSSVPNGGTFGDWIELANSSASPVSLDGWSLSDEGNGPKFVFPAGTTIPANSFLVVWCDAVPTQAPGLHAGFALDREGDSVFLDNAGGQRVDAVTFGHQLADLTIGRVNGEWMLTSPTPMALNSSVPTAPASSLSINEWLANAVPGTDDWIELYNRSATLPVSLNGVHLSSAGTVFQIRSLAYAAPGGFVQLLADEGGGPQHLDFKLPAAGGEIALYDAAALLVERVTYGSQSEGVSQGRLPNGSATIVGFPGSVSPGASNYAAVYTGPFLSEVLARNDAVTAPWGAAADWVELANPTGAAVDVGGLGLSDSPGGGLRWFIPAGTTIPANGFLRLWCDGERPASTSGGADLNTGFALSGDSGGVYLFNAGGQLVDSVEYGFQVVNLSLGRSGGIATPWRLLSSPTPGAANSAPVTLGSPAGIRLNEWMSEPLSGNDWFELYNPGVQPVDLAGLYLTDDPSVAGVTQYKVAPLSFIGAGGVVVFQADGDPSQGRDHVNFNLDRHGETLRIYSANLDLIDTADVLVYPPGVSAGRVPDGSGTTVTFYTSPTRGQPNYLPLPNVVIHEVLTHTDLPLRDSIELYNPTAQPVNIGGYFLSDHERDLKKYRITDGTTIQPGEFLVFDDSQFNTGGPGSFALSSSRGGVVYLSGADAAGTLTGLRTVFPFGPQVNGVSFGRVPTSVGVDYPALVARTLGSANAAVRVGPVVFNEVQYHPVDGAALTEDAAHEYVELHNVSGVVVSLFDPANPGNTWRVRGGVTFQFPGGVFLPSRGYAVLVSFDPLSNPTAAAAFRSKYAMAGSVPLYGPFLGRLDNAGEELVLEMPDAPQTGPEAGYVPYVEVDRLSFGVAYPWPDEAAGQGESLQRRRPYAYGNDPLNWKAQAPTAGRANVPGSTFLDSDQDGLPDAFETAHGLNPANAADALLDADGDTHANYEEYLDGTDLASAGSRLDAPVIVAQPADVNAIPGQTVTLTVDVGVGPAAAGGGALQYQWNKNGYPIAGATGTSLVIVPQTPADTAAYSVVVWNGAGFVVSRSARVVVNIPPRVTLQPVSLVVNPGSNIVFSVAATGTGLVRYQWQRDGQDLPGATSATLAINNAQLQNEGEYVAVVSDEVATIRSQAARLIVKVPVTIVTAPVGVTNVVGSTVSFTVVAAGSIPMRFEWRKGSLVIATYHVTNRTSTYTITNARTNDTGLYRVVITNSATTLPGISPNQVQLTILEPAVITVQPRGLAVEPGAPAAFSVSATGSALRYQWQRNGTPLANATNATFGISAAQAADAGDYRVVVFNAASSVTSDVATLAVNSPSPLRLSDLEVLPNGHVRMNLSGPPNRTFTIERSPDLLDWIFLGTLDYTNGLMPFLDTTALGPTNRFYRARQ